MSVPEPRLTVGIEEEYLLVERTSRDLAAAPPDSMLDECEALLEGRVSPEFLRAQIEVGTHPAATVAEARADLAHLRSTVARVSEAHGLAPIAASTHPFARWQDQQHVHKERYDALARDLQAVARRLVICGMHIHVEVGDDDLRIDLMNQMSYFLPHLLALTTSSPFWAGEDTGLASYRLTVFDALPRTGLPERYESFGEYQRVVAQLVQGGLMEDATKLWWDLRPSARYPTLEMRIGDVCTRLDDAAAVAALTQCIISMLYRLRESWSTKTAGAPSATGSAIPWSTSARVSWCPIRRCSKNLSPWSARMPSAWAASPRSSTPAKLPPGAPAPTASAAPSRRPRPPAPTTTRPLKQWSTFSSKRPFWVSIEFDRRLPWTTKPAPK